ncbi:hypothetical protein BKA82DRAFT_4018164 [Pisolithus tinctorius]|nr:hypothetical protein BKA82DRAFT_4018164 [Pisolithus tinctorius]
MPHVMPTPTPPAQETEIPTSNKGKWKVTKAEVEQMIAEGSHRMEVDDEGEDEVPEKEDDEEEPATAETNDEDDISAQGQSKHKPHPPSDRLYGHTAIAFRRMPSPDPHSSMPKVALLLQLNGIHREPGGKTAVQADLIVKVGPSIAQEVEESMVADTHPLTTVTPVQPTTAATPSAPSPICAPITKVSQMSNTIEQ